MRLPNPFAAALLLVFCFCSAPALASPNVLLILADDMSWVGTSVQMDPNVPGSRSDYHRTPNLERLAREGMRFTDAYAPHPNCSPTRLAIQTSKSPAQLRMTDIIGRGSGRYYEGLPMIPPQHIDHIPHAETTIAELLAAHRPGYVKGHFGKWHLGGGGPGRHGYDEHSGATSNREGRSPAPDPKRTVSVTTRAIDFLRHRKQADEPFFLQVSYYAIHLAVFAFDETIRDFEGRPKGERHNHAAHAAMTHETDAAVGRLLEALDELELADDTYVIFTSDNGSYHHSGSERIMTNAPLRGQKASIWEGGIRVPLFVRGPGVQAGAVSRVPVTGMDFYPTIAELLGVRAELPRRIEGGSLAQLLRNGGEGAVRRWRSELVWHFPHYQTDKGSTPSSAIRSGNWKLIKLYEPQEVKLFDLAEDIGETQDAAERNPQVARRLEQRLQAYLEEIDASMAVRR